jgi:exopolysaccharide biosynthesis polyprenyl glycosylphosphotransferase
MTASTGRVSGNAVDVQPVHSAAAVPADVTVPADITAIPLSDRTAWRLRLFLGGIRAWMVQLPVDAALVMAPVLWRPDSMRTAVLFAALALLFITGGDRYRARLELGVLEELPTLVGRLLMAAALVAMLIALRHQPNHAIAFLKDAAVAIGLVCAGRTLTTALVAWGRRKRLTAHRTILVGGGVLATELAHKLNAQPRYGLSVVGFVDQAGDQIASSVLPHLGTLDDLDDVARAYGVDVLLVADGDFTETALHRAVRTEAAERCDVLVVPRLHHFNTLARRADHIGSIPVMRIRTPNLAGPGLAIKRAFDVVVSGLALLFLAPLMGAIALAVRSEGPDVIFRQPRVGRNGRVFDVLKFRSMRPVDEHESATNWSIADDDRVGPIGRILRRTSLDEIPQLWNILRGDMSLVGPRPERPHFVEQFTQQYDLYAQRHRVKAGLTGLAQVSGLRGDTSIADRARYDNYYIENWSLWMDVKIIVRTVSEVLFARGR